MAAKPTMAAWHWYNRDFTKKRMITHNMNRPFKEVQDSLLSFEGSKAEREKFNTELEICRSQVLTPDQARDKLVAALGKSDGPYGLMPFHIGIIQNGVNQIYVFQIKDHGVWIKDSPPPTEERKPRKITFEKPLFVIRMDRKPRFIEQDIMAVLDVIPLDIVVVEEWKGGNAQVGFDIPIGEIAGLKVDAEMQKFVTE